MVNKRIELLPGVFLTCVRSEKFKTGCLSVSLLRPLRREEASANALLSTVLLRGCRDYPNIRSISAFLDRLYGASIGTLVRKKGEVQTTGFYADFLEDRLALDGEPVLEPMAGFLCALLLDPVLEDGVFAARYVEGEKQNLIHAIESRIDDKRSYAVTQLFRGMCGGEAYGVPRLGDKEDVERVNAASLYAHYRDILATSQIEIFYHGSASSQSVARMFRRGLDMLPRRETVPFGSRVVKRAKEVRELGESLDVTQGKLAMGFRLGCTAADPEYPAALLMNAVYGAGVTSKLFTNVREKLSLCYYASSSIEKFKGLMVVGSGIDFDRFEEAKGEILRQLALTAQGEITSEELENARTHLISSLRAGMDSPGRMDDYSLGQVLLGAPGGTMADLADELRGVTAKQVAAAAKRVSLDTVYFLEGVKE